MNEQQTKPEVTGDIKVKFSFSTNWADVTYEEALKAARSFYRCLMLIENDNIIKHEKRVVEYINAHQLQGVTFTLEQLKTYDTK